MGFIKEFKEFSIKGNVIDMAIGIVLGGAFGKIVSSFVEDVIMPPIGILMGGVDFKSLAITLKESVGGAPAVTLNYGKFIQTTIDFVIIALAIFIVIRAINSMRRAQEAAPAPPPAPSNEETLLTEIRDLLKRDRG